LDHVNLHREPVDFRKSINGLALIVEQEMCLSPLSSALFVFCNKNRNRVKALYWDQTGFCLWLKRLEKQKFKWPLTYPGETMRLDEADWRRLLMGYDILGQLMGYDILGHVPLRGAKYTG